MGPILYLSDTEQDFVHGGFEGGDWLMISSDLRTLSVHTAAGPHVDQLFVVTGTPEPSTVMLIAAGLLCLGLLRARRLAGR